MLLRMITFAILWILAEALGRFEEEEAARFNIRPEPLPPLPGMTRRVHHHHNGPPGPPSIAPPLSMIRAMRKEHLSSLARSSIRRHPHLQGISRRLVHKQKKRN